MFQLRLFNGPYLEGEAGSSIDPVLQQPKRLAVLAYLAFAGPGGYRKRDALLALFWPEINAARARSSLNQAIHYLRAVLGSDVILSRGSSDLGLSAKSLWCDVIAFDQALRQNDLVGALALYKGDLLPAFYVDAGSEFEQWLDGERNRLRRSASLAAWTLANSAEQTGDSSSAEEWARRAAQFAPNDENALRKLLLLLHRIGDAAGAREAYNAFVAYMATEYGEEPSRELRDLVAHLKPTRLVGHHAPNGQASASVRATSQQKTTATDCTTGGTDVQPSTSLSSGPAADVHVGWATPQGRLRQTPNTYRWLHVVTAAVLGTAGWGRWMSDQRGPLDGRAEIVVTPFRALNDSAASTTLSQTLTAAVLHQLASVKSLVVSLGPLHRRQSNLLPQLSVVARVLQAGPRVRTDVEIYDMLSGEIVKTVVFEHPSGELLPLADTLSLEITSVVQSVAGHEVRLLRRNGSKESSKAYALMQMADEEHDLADQLAKSGDFAVLAKTLREEASTLASTESIAPTWVEPRVDRAGVLQQLALLHRTPPLRDSVRMAQLLSQSIAEADGAVALDGANASALDALGSASYLYWLLVSLPSDSAMRIRARAEQNLLGAVRADPGRATAWSMLSSSFYARADYVDAYLAASKAYHADAYLENPQEILDGLAVYAYEIGDDSASAQWCDELNRRFENSWPSAYCKLRQLAWSGATGRKVVSNAWKTAIAGSHDVSQTDVEPYLQMLVASVLAQNGLRDSAESMIHRLHQSADADPELLPLEADTRMRLGQNRLAVALLMQYLDAKPAQRSGVVRSRRFAGLSGLQLQLTRLHVPGRTTSQ